MPLDLPLRCRCGHVRGVARAVGPPAGFRFICYCRDCQSFARFLARPDVLDSAGGTDIFQMPPSRIKIITGVDAVRCVRVSDRTKVVRWYADCCRTPIANTADSPRFPIVGLIHSFIDHANDDRSRDEVLGAPLCRVYESSAIGPLPASAPPPASFGVFIHRATKLLGWWARGFGRPNPFFDDRANEPLSAPHVLAPSERSADGPQ